MWCKNLYIIFPKISRYIKGHDGSKYLTLIPIDEKDKSVLKNYQEMLDKIKYLTKLNNNYSDHYDEKKYENQV